MLRNLLLSSIAGRWGEIGPSKIKTKIARSNIFQERRLFLQRVCLSTAQRTVAKVVSFFFLIFLNSWNQANWRDPVAFEQDTLRSEAALQILGRHCPLGLEVRGRAQPGWRCRQHSVSRQHRFVLDVGFWGEEQLGQVLIFCLPGFAVWRCGHAGSKGLGASAGRVRQASGYRLTLRAHASHRSEELTQVLWHFPAFL